MNFIADLHIHSRFSMATSRALTLDHLAQWAMRKGIDVLGSGDFTHPAWRAELAENLVFDEASGLYRPKATIMEDNTPYFCLQSEISCIYKKDGRTRKNHNLIFAPNLEAAEKISSRLAKIGNLASDGRPILGVDAHDLLEIVLECAPDAIFIPAHVWTPWFSLFGSKSGFNAIEECFGDLTSHIFALETGLSSDPPMNRLVSKLDNFALISNSDAHSGPNLGREANLFSGAPSWHGMFDALRASAKRLNDPELPSRFLGTLEFYPEEGKYHMDGHRACGVMLTPAESNELGDICPVCGKPLTIGVLHRVLELADRDEPATYAGQPEMLMLIPLPEIVGEICGVKSSTRKAQAICAHLGDVLGPELRILRHLPLEQISACWQELGEAMRRLRRGEVFINPGFDGQYGSIKLFTTDELAQMRGSMPDSLKKI